MLILSYNVERPPRHSALIMWVTKRIDESFWVNGASDESDTTRAFKSSDPSHRLRMTGKYLLETKKIPNLVTKIGDYVI